MHSTPPSSLHRLFALVPALLLACAAAATAQTVINSVPFTINASGKYVVGKNLNYAGTGYAISISKPNVDLDLNGFYISGPANTASTSGVIFVGDVANVSIHNGLVSNAGFGLVFYGTENARNYLVENMIISRCYVSGIYFAGAAPGTRIRNNSFSNLGGSTYQPNSGANAINSRGGVRIENNLIANVTGVGTGSSYGIDATATDFSIGNTISNCDVGISNGKYLDNLTDGCTTPFTGGTNAVGNN